MPLPPLDHRLYTLPAGFLSCTLRTHACGRRGHAYATLLFHLLMLRHLAGGRTVGHVAVSRRREGDHAAVHDVQALFICCTQPIFMACHNVSGDNISRLRLLVTRHHSVILNTMCQACDGRRIFGIAPWATLLLAHKSRSLASYRDSINACIRRRAPLSTISIACMLRCQAPLKRPVRENSAPSRSGATSRHLTGHPALAAATLPGLRHLTSHAALLATPISFRRLSTRHIAKRPPDGDGGDMTSKRRRYKARRLRLVFYRGADFRGRASSVHTGVA